MASRPGTPRPEEGDIKAPPFHHSSYKIITQDEGVYRSIFQQPQLEIPHAPPSYTWFELFLHPKALEKHLQLLRDEATQSQHGAMSAIELIREFLDQAQLVADESNNRNKRYQALIQTAAKVALQMEITLKAIESSLPKHLQRLLVDGIVELCDSNGNEKIKALEAQLLHHRWVLRTVIDEHQNGMFTASSRSEANDITASFQLAIGDFSQLEQHQQVTQTIERILSNNAAQTITPQVEIEVQMDLAMYYFTFQSFDKAYECSKKSLALINGQNEVSTLQVQEVETLQGIFAACEAMIEMQGDGNMSTTKLMHQAWENKEFEELLLLLKYDLKEVSDPNRMIHVEARQKLEKQSLEQFIGVNTLSNVNLASARSLYKKISINNALAWLFKKEYLASSRDQCFCCWLRLLNEEIAYDANNREENLTSSKLLISYALDLCTYLIQSVDLKASKKALVWDLVYLIFINYPWIVKHEAWQKFTETCGTPEHVNPSCEISHNTLEKRPLYLAKAVHVQRNFNSCLSKPKGKYSIVINENIDEAGGSESQREMAGENNSHPKVMVIQWCEKLSNELSQIMDNEKQTSISSRLLPTRIDQNTMGEWKNILYQATANNCWDLLIQWRKAIVMNDSKFESNASPVGNYLDFVLAGNEVMKYLSQSLGTKGGDDMAALPMFSIRRLNAIFQHLLVKRRSLLSHLNVLPTIIEIDRQSYDGYKGTENSEITHLLLDLPLWILNQLVTCAAGYLHRGFMQKQLQRSKASSSLNRQISNTSQGAKTFPDILGGLPITFDLTSYGDRAFIIAFSLENNVNKSDPGQIVESTSNVLDTLDFLNEFHEDLSAIFLHGLECLSLRCPREPRWQCAKADLFLDGIYSGISNTENLNLSTTVHQALRHYLVAASLATNFFTEMTSFTDIIHQRSLVRLSQCLVQLEAHVAAAVLFQIFPSEEFSFGIRLLQTTDVSTHDSHYFQYFWELSFLEVLVHMHSSNTKCSRNVELLTKLIQSPELNVCNPTPVQKEVQARILKCYFRALCQQYL